MASVGYGNELLTDDPLDFLRNLIISLTPFGYRYFRWWCVAFFLYGLVVEIVTVYKTFHCENKCWFCLVGVLVRIPGIACQISSAVIDLRMKAIRKSMFSNCNSLTSVSGKISKDIKWMRTYCIIQLIANVVLYGTNFPMSNEERKFLCSEMFFEELFGRFHNLIFFTSIIVMIANGLVATHVLAQILYMSVHMKYQYNLIQEYVEDMKHMMNDGRDDIHYQLSVSKRIANFVKQHQKINRLREYCDPLGSLLALGVPVLTETMTVSILFVLATNVSATIMAKGVISLIFVLSYILPVLYSGQMLIDECDKLHNLLCEVPWTDWDVKNRKSLLIILLITAKPKKLCCFGLCEVSFVSILSIAKLGYSLLALVMNLT